VERLLAESSSAPLVTLDAIGDAIGATPVTYDQIERIVERLENAGRTVGQPPLDLTADLRRVLLTARDLRQRLGRAPRIAELATEAELPLVAVIAALRFARTMG
jgi:hypothetical protein